MSAIAAIYNVPATGAEFSSWAFAHAAHHTDIIRTIYQITGGQLDQYVLDPFDPSNPGPWLYQHQVMHQQMDSVLGIAGYNLLEADFKNRENLSGWIWLNADEHKRAADALGIG